MSTSNESLPYEQPRKEDTQLSSCRDIREKSISMVRAEGEPTSRIQYLFQGLRLRSLFTVPEHEALQNYNDEFTAQISKSSESVFHAGKKRFLSDSNGPATKRQKAADSVDRFNNRYWCNNDLENSERTS
ncbi:hypothetical protein FOMG_19782 [Fusarium oxysporum f. sp. melonis 26406]|uniref:Uncharacterized protein n=1 Tax=Fusarium oxysporum f. sp. melonis 26406 TaxID=1089452 RepID=W9Z596_FUSOX|nr:hypothetical protein FOMG_19782 [Fusarium oxysporum f. sp. melonis 26406]